MFKKIIYILTILKLLISCDIKTADEYLVKALEFQKQEKYVEAIALLDKAIEKRPRFLSALMNRGNDKSKLKKYKESIDDYKKVLEMYPDNTLALFNIGNNYRNLNDYKNAIIYYSKALNTKGALNTFMKFDDTTYISFKFEFIDDYEVLDYDIFFERGIAYLKQKQFDKAISDIKKSLRTNKAKRDCYLILGKAYLGKNDTDNACNNFIKSARLGNKEAKIMYRKYCIKKQQK